MVWIKLEEINRPDGLARRGALDNESHLARSIYVELLLVDQTSQNIAREWRHATAHAPHLGVVLPAVHRLDVFDLKCPQAARRTLDIHPVVLQSDNLVVDKHRHAPRIGILAHLRLAELGVLIHKVERIFVGRMRFL